MLHAHIFSFEYYERRATLIDPVVEYPCSPAGCVSLCLTGCLGFTLYRSQYPTGPNAQLEWEYRGGFNLCGDAGVRLLLTKRLFVAPEVPLGWVPFLGSTIAVGYRF